MGKRLVIAAIAALAANVAAPAQQRQAELVTGSIPHAQPVARGPSWSGESGASGDPAMSAEAIRAAAANFHSCLAGLWPQAARRGVSRRVFESATAALTPDLHIMDLMDAQPEFTKAVWDYLDILVTDARIAKGRALLARYAGVFDAVERAYGVDRYTIAAIWGVETNYGTLAGSKPVLQSTATLACIGRRQHYFRDEFLDTLAILQRGDIPANRLVGSWAGAFGPTQFMPSAFKRYAVDFDGDGRRDVISSVPDLIASTANNLKKDGWVAGQTWGYEVVVPATLDFRLAGRSHAMSLAQWQQLGVVRPHGAAFAHPNDQAFLLVPAGIQGPGFLMLRNFKVIMRYNPAEAYALGIGHLADRLRGGGAFVQHWPR
jgi:membrane-bound lytic murein transglycosylase B